MNINVISHSDFYQSVLKEIQMQSIAESPDQVQQLD